MSLHHLHAPLVVETFPVRVVVERALLELLRATGDLGRIRHRIAADVHAAVDDAVIDAERRRQTVHSGIRRTERDIRGFRRHHVEGRHRLGEVHGVVEPEAVVVRLAELDVVRIRGLRALGARHHLQRARQWKATGAHWRTLHRCTHAHPSSPSWSRSISATGNVSAANRAADDQVDTAKVRGLPARRTAAYGEGSTRHNPAAPPCNGAELRALLSTWKSPCSARAVDVEARSPV